MWALNGLPEEINKSIYLSYQDLPTHLKRCFLYCALIPKGEEIFSGYVIAYWIAESLVQPNQTSDLLEEIGEGYFKELVLRNLLEPIFLGYGNEFWYRCSMSDVVRVFAQYVLKEDVIHESNRSLHDMNRSKRGRRISLRGYSTAGSLWRGRPLRSLLLFECPRLELECLPKFLRVLDLTGSTLTHLPNSVYHLKHLRCLNLERTTIVELSSDIKYLMSLQFLNISCCSKLSQLPESIVELHNLRYFCAYDSGVKCFPKGLEKLQNLVFFEVPLSNSGCHAQELSSLEDLAALRNLATLCLERLEESSISDSTSLILKQMEHLDYLSIACTPVVGTEEEMSDLEAVFNRLCPPASLTELRSFNGYFGKRLPNWLSSGVLLPSLQVFYLVNLPCCDVLPTMGILPSLKIVVISNVPQVRHISHEFFYSDETPSKNSFDAFPELKFLAFEHMDNLSEWHWDAAEVAMPKLQELRIKRCSILASLPGGLMLHAISLTRLEIEDCGNMTSIHSLISLQTLTVIGCSILQSISNLPKLLSLEINNCPKLEMVDNVDILLSVALCDYEMRELPRWLTMLIGRISKVNLYGSKELCDLAVQTYGPEKLNMSTHGQVKSSRFLMYS